MWSGNEHLVKPIVPSTDREQVSEGSKVSEWGLDLLGVRRLLRAQTWPISHNARIGSPEKEAGMRTQNCKLSTERGKCKWPVFNLAFFAPLSAIYPMVLHCLRQGKRKQRNYTLGVEIATRVLSSLAARARSPPSLPVMSANGKINAELSDCACGSNGE